MGYEFYSRQSRVSRTAEAKYNSVGSKSSHKHDSVSFLSCHVRVLCEILNSCEYSKRSSAANSTSDALKISAKYRWTIFS